MPLAVAKQAVASAVSRGTPITPAIISYQQNEANTFQKLGLIPSHLQVQGIFDLPFNRTVAQLHDATGHASGPRPTEPGAGPGAAGLRPRPHPHG